MFKTLQAKVIAATRIDEKTKSVTGFLLGARFGIGKFKSAVYHLEDTRGNRIDVWGTAAIDGCLMSGKRELNREFLGKLVRFTYIGSRKIKGRKQAMRDIRVEVDTAKNLKVRQDKDSSIQKKSKTYLLK